MASSQANLEHRITNGYPMGNCSAQQDLLLMQNKYDAENTIRGIILRKSDLNGGNIRSSSNQCTRCQGSGENGSKCCPISNHQTLRDCCAIPRDSSEHVVNQRHDITHITSGTKQTTNTTDNGNVHINNTLKPNFHQCNQKRGKYVTFPNRRSKPPSKIPVLLDSTFRHATLDSVYHQRFPRATGASAIDNEAVKTLITRSNKIHNSGGKRPEAGRSEPQNKRRAFRSKILPGSSNMKRWNDWQLKMSDDRKVTTSDDKEVTTSDDREVTTSDDREVTTSDAIEVTTSDDRDVTTSDDREVTTRDDREVTTSDDREVTTSDDREVTTSDNRDVTTSDDVDLSLESQRKDKRISRPNISKASTPKTSLITPGTNEIYLRNAVNRLQSDITFSDDIISELKDVNETLRVASEVLKHSADALDAVTTLMKNSIAANLITDGAINISKHGLESQIDRSVGSSAMERKEPNNCTIIATRKYRSKIPVPMKLINLSLLPPPRNIVPHDIKQQYLSIPDVGKIALSCKSSFNSLSPDTVHHLDSSVSNKALEVSALSKNTSVCPKRNDRMLRRSSPGRCTICNLQNTDALHKEGPQVDVPSTTESITIISSDAAEEKTVNWVLSNDQVPVDQITYSTANANSNKSVLANKADKGFTMINSVDTVMYSESDDVAPAAQTNTAISGHSHIPLPYLPTEEVNRYKNIHLAQVLIPQVFSVVLKWGCSNKQNNETFMDYLKREKAVSTRQLKKYYKMSPGNVDTLKREKHSSALDVTVLFPLIQIACEGLEDRHHPIWLADDDTKLECLLMKAKNKRNKICHGVRSEAVSNLVFEQGYTILKQLLKLSGQIFKQDDDIIKIELETFTDQIEELALTSEERRLIDLQHLFHTEGLAESKSYWEEYCTTDAMPFTDDIVKRDKVFHPMEVHIRDVSSPDADSQTISYKKILQKSDVEGTRASIIRGDAGSGKTTMMKNMALQFLGIVPNEVKFLDEIHLLLSLECRDRQAKTLKEFIENNFPKTCRKVTTDEALKCFSYIGNLIFIDGVDELNECSAQVVKEIVHAMKSSMPFCHIIFSTRPHAVIPLESFLKKEGVPFHSYELVKISEEKDQLEFLRRYESTSSHSSNVSGMKEAFKDLKDEVKEFFVYPINLILFCYLFLYSPESIKKWQNSNDVIGQILVLYEMFIERKLIEYSIPNLKFRIRELLSEVNCYALECLAKNKILLSEAQFDDIQDRCAVKLAEWGLLQVDANVILSVVFLTKFSPTACSKPTYQFFHRSIQEMMAGRALAKILREMPNHCTRDILKKQLGMTDKVPDGDSIEQGTFSRFLNVLRFVVTSLTEFETIQELRGHLLRIMAIMNEEGPEFGFWSELVLSCPSSEDVAMAAAKAYTNESWTVNSPGELAVAARVMKHLQILLVKVSLARNVRTPVALQFLLKTLKEPHSGGLWLELHQSLWDYAPTDELLTHLQSARCHMREFRGCLGSSQEAAQVLAGAVARSSRAAKLEISLAEPDQHHLMELQGTRYFLKIRVRVSVPCPTPHRRPLPRAPKRAPALTVECCPAAGADDVAAIIVALAPDDNRYCLLQLQRWAREDTALDQLLLVLTDGGVRTAGFGDQRWEPALTDDNEDCSVCQGTTHPPDERCVELWLP